jgi:hypothetical protein
LIEWGTGFWARAILVRMACRAAFYGARRIDIQRSELKQFVTLGDWSGQFLGARAQVQPAQGR